MATLTTNPTAATGFFANILAPVFDQMMKRRIYRTTVAELSRLSARELDDLGITRSDINRIAREAAGMM